MTSSRRAGAAYAAFAAATWGTVFVLSKWLLALRGLSICTLAFWRFAFASAALFAMLCAARRLGAAWRAFRDQPLRFLVMGLAGGYVMYLSVLLSLRFTYANTTQIVMNSNAVFIAPLSLLIGERLTRRGVWGLVLGLAGCALVVWGSPVGAGPKECNHLLGGAFAVLGGLSWASYTVMSRNVIRRYGGLECTAVAMTLAAVFLAATVAVKGDGFALTRRQAGVILYLGVAPTALGFAAWFKAMEALPANVVGPFQFLQPVIGVTLAIVFLHETLSARMVVGALLVFVGVWFTLSGAERSE